jgi:hypothetical protein
MAGTAAKAAILCFAAILPMLAPAKTNADNTKPTNSDMPTSSPMLQLDAANMDANPHARFTIGAGAHMNVIVKDPKTKQSTLMK